jgi:hypothetical protein
MLVTNPNRSRSNLHALPDTLRISPLNAHALFEYQRHELIRRTKPFFGFTKLRLTGVPTWIRGYTVSIIVTTISTIK